MTQINIFKGFLVLPEAKKIILHSLEYSYPSITKEFSAVYTLSIEKNSFGVTDVILLLGPKRCGKTTLMRLLANLYPDYQTNFTVAYKPQKVVMCFPGTVQELLRAKFQILHQKDSLLEQKMKILNQPIYLISTYTFLAILFDIREDSPLMEIYDSLIGRLLTRKVSSLYKNEISKIAFMLVLMKNVDVYLFDGISTGLGTNESHQIAQLIKCKVLEHHKVAFIAEDNLDIVMKLANKALIFERAENVFNCETVIPLEEAMEKYVNSLGAKCKFIDSN